MSRLIYENNWADWYEKNALPKTVRDNQKGKTFKCRDTDEVFERTKSGYRKYLNSEQWRLVKKRFRSFYKSNKMSWECACCYIKTDLHVHHKTYIRIGGYESSRDDLMLLCKDCHIGYHKYLKEHNNKYMPIEKFRQYKLDNYDIKPRKTILRKANPRENYE